MENGRNSAHLNAFKFCKFGDPIIFSNYFTILIIQKKEKKHTHTHKAGSMIVAIINLKKN